MSFSLLKSGAVWTGSELVYTFVSNPDGFNYYDNTGVEISAYFEAVPQFDAFSISQCTAAQTILNQWGQS